MRGSGQSGKARTNNPPPWIREEQDQDEHDMQDDEWFFKSIRRYEHLCMYALSCRPTSLSLSSDGTHLALCGTTHTGRDEDEEDQAEEIMVLALPDKLLLSGDPRQEGLRANRRDFALRAGAREKKGAAPLLQVQFCDAQVENDLLTLNKDAVTRWTITKGSDVLSKTAQVRLDVGCPASRFGLSDNLLAAQGVDRVWILSTGGGKLVKLETWHHDESAEGRLQAVAVDCENREVTMATCTGRARRRRLTQQQNDMGEREEQNGNKANGTFISKVENVESLSSEVVVGICQQKASTFAVIQGGRISVKSFNSQQDLATSTDRGLSERVASSVKWNGRTDEFLVVGSGDNSIRAYSYDADAGEVRFKFAHDGHRSPVTDAVSHPRVLGLVLSADARGHLHAWAPSHHLEVANNKVIVADL